MLTDEELTTRLSAAFQETTPELTYAGPVPRVSRRGTGLVATSALAAAAALVMTPAALDRGDGGPMEPSASPGAHRSALDGPPRVNTLDIGRARLSDAQVDGEPGNVYFIVEPDGSTVPPDAEKVDLGLPYDVWVVDNPASGEPQAYVGHRTCPDTVEGCNGEPPRLEVYGILAPGWTQEQVLYLIEHPLYAQSTDVDGQLVMTPHS
jgi:hypothetical protein